MCVTGALEGHKDRKNWNKHSMTCWSEQEHSGFLLYSLTPAWEGLRLLWGYKGWFAAKNMRGKMPFFSSTVCEIMLSGTHLQNGMCCIPTSTEETCKCINRCEKRNTLFLHLLQIWCSLTQSAVNYPMGIASESSLPAHLEYSFDSVLGGSEMHRNMPSLDLKK